MSKVAVGVRSVSLGGGVKALGDGVQTGGGSGGNCSNKRTVGSVGEGVASVATKVVGVSGPLTVVVSEVVVRSVRSVFLGGGIKSLGDGVQTGGGSEGNSSNNGMAGVGEGKSSVSVATKVVGVGLGISGPLAVGEAVVGNGKSSLGHGVKTLGDGVQTRGRTERSDSIVMGVRERSVVAVEGIGLGLGLDGRNEGSLRDMPILEICSIGKKTF